MRLHEMRSIQIEWASCCSFPFYWIYAKCQSINASKYHFHHFSLQKNNVKYQKADKNASVARPAPSLRFALKLWSTWVPSSPSGSAPIQSRCNNNVFLYNCRRFLDERQMTCVVHLQMIQIILKVAAVSHFFIYT